MNPPATWRCLRRCGLPLLLYTILALVLTWPLLLHFSTHVPGDGIDDPSLAWNLWWIKLRLVDQLQPDFFHAGWMFHPVGINLAFYTLTPLNGLLSVPLQTAADILVANNLLLLASFVLAAFGAYLLALDQLVVIFPRLDPRHTVPTEQRAPGWALWAAALLAGGIYAFASSKLFYAALGQFNIASSQWIPFCALYLLRMVRAPALRPALRAGALAGLFFVFQAWSELTFASFLLIFAALLLLWRLFAGPGVVDEAKTALPGRSADGLRPSAPAARRSSWLHLAAACAAFGAICLVGLWPFLAAMLPDLRAEGDFFAKGGGFADIFSADLLGYLLPTQLHPLLGSLVAGQPFPHDKGQQIFVGYATMALAASGFIVLVAHRSARIRRWGWFWGIVLLCFWLLTLGPNLRWAGHDLPIPGPFSLISRLPFFSGNRYPSRYSIMLMLAAAVLAACGLYWLAGRLARAQRRSLAAATGVVLAGLIMFEHLSLPLPLSDLRTPSIYTELAALARSNSASSVLLELPTGWRNGARVLGKSDLLIMLQEWYQTTHALPRLGGNTSRNPEYKFQYFTNAPLIGDLIALMNADRPHLAPLIAAGLPAMIARDRALAPQVLADLGIRYVTVHVEKAPPALLEFIDQALPLDLIDEWRGPNWSGAPSTIRLYAVQPAAQPVSRTLDLAGPLANLYLGEGWSPAADARGVRWATRADPVLLLPIPTAGADLTLNLAQPAAGLAARVNGQPAAVQPVPGQPSKVRVKIAPGAAAAPVDRLELHFADPPQAAAALASAQPVSLAGAGFSLPPATAVLVQSAGEEVGNFAHIYVNGRDVAIGARGYNLAALDPATGRVLDSTVFDTFADTAASRQLADWVRQWPTGAVIAGAVADEASQHLDQPAIDALHTLGVQDDLRSKFRWSHAFLGAVGAPAGAALEDSTLLQPAQVWSGAPLDGPEVYGGLHAATIGPPAP